MENFAETIFKKKIQNIGTKIEKLSYEKKLKSSRFSNTLEKIKGQLESNFSLFIEGHIDRVSCVAVTKDNKYIISGSEDKTIRIWNILQKTQEAVLKGHVSCINSVAVT